MSVLFSVIIPVYNVEEFLPRCLDSILKQGCRSYEIVLVDDGSADNSGKICDQYVEKYSQCRVIHQENKGLAGARNTGLRYALGKYIVFVDSDDYIEKELLTKAYYYLEEQKYDAFSFAARRVNEKEEILYEMRFQEGIGAYLLSAEERIKFLLTSFLQYILGWEVCFYVYRKDIIEQNGMRFDESIRYAEDLPFTFEYMLYAKNLIKVPDVLYNYTMRNDSITQKANSERMLQGIFDSVFSNIQSNLREDEGYLYYAALLNYFAPAIIKEIDVSEFRLKMKTLDSQKNHQKYWKSIVEHESELHNIFGENGRKIYDIASYLLSDK